MASAAARAALMFAERAAHLDVAAQTTAVTVAQRVRGH